MFSHIKRNWCRHSVKKERRKFRIIYKKLLGNSPPAVPFFRRRTARGA